VASIYEALTGALASDFNGTGTALGGAFEAEWTHHLKENQQNWYYYKGHFALELGEQPDDGSDAPLLYPLEINLAKMLCRTRAGILLGEFDPDDPAGPIGVKFGDPKESGRALGRINAADEAWRKINEVTPLGPMILRGAVEQGVTGGWWVQIKKRPQAVPWLVYRSDDNIRPVWHPDNPAELEECSFTSLVSYSQAALLAESVGKKLEKKGVDHVEYTETWTKKEVILLLDRKVIHRSSNPFENESGGLIPFVYFPHDRSLHEFYGDSLIPDIVGLMLEINIRLRDIGDDVEYRSHPYIWARDLRKNDQRLPRKPSAVWNLGQTGLQGEPPTVGVLDAKGVDSSAFEYLDRLDRMLRYMTSITPVDLGEDEGSQRSGLTLEVRKLPGIHSVKRTRTLWTSAMRQLVQKSLLVYAQSFKRVEVPPLAHINPIWPALLPRERDSVIKEIVDLSNLPEPRISPERAVDLLGIRDAEQELKRWEEMKKEREEKEAEQAEKQHEQAVELVKSKPSPAQSQAKASAGKKAAAR
jgi:hypothetical protein